MLPLLLLLLLAAPPTPVPGLLLCDMVGGVDGEDDVDRGTTGGAGAGGNGDDSAEGGPAARSQIGFSKVKSLGQKTEMVPSKPA
jgi:hypothetical protein